MSRTAPSPATVVAALALLGACAAGGADPPVVPLAAPAAAEPAPTEPPAAAPAEPGGADPAPDAAGTDDELCRLARDPELAGDPSRWEPFWPAIEAALPGRAVASLLEGFQGQEPATPVRLAAMDLVWDLIDERCDLPLRARQCRSLVMVALADPLGWGARGGEAEEVEAAFDLALANLGDLRRRAEDPALVASLDAHLAVAAGARAAFAAAGWGPGGLDGLEPLAAELARLGEPALLDPLTELEATCGFR